MRVENLKESAVNIRDIKGTFVISRCELKPFKNKDGNYLQCELSDKTGAIKGVVWEGADKLHEWLHNKMVVSISGELTRYNDVPQVVIRSVNEQSEFNPEDFVPALDIEKQKSNRDTLISIAESIKNPVCGPIWDYIVNNRPKNQLHEKFFMCPGGVGDVHHAYLGGLVEHVTFMISLAETAVDLHHLDRDVTLTGCLVHDIGKTEGYSWDMVIEMNDVGRLLHHIPIGFGLLNDIARATKIDQKEGDTLIRLLHVIVSHHANEGHRKPMFPEAQIVSELDSLDASVNLAKGFMSDPNNMDDSNKWTKFCRVSERQYYLQGLDKALELPQIKSTKQESTGIY